MKKTALTQLIDEIKGMKSLLNNQESRVAECMTVITDRATELLETEREQIEEAVEYGFLDALKPISNQDKTFQQYYKDTYE